MSSRSALIIGASGQVGAACMRAFSDRGYAVTGTYARTPKEGLVPLDIGDAAAIRNVIAERKPDVVVLSAAMTHVDGCEADPARARLLNAEAPRVTAETGARVVYLSTEYVFDGVDGPYEPDDQPNAISMYGLTKLEGERAVLRASQNNLVVRTTVVYSYQPDGKNFMMQLWGNLRAGKSMRVPADQISTPTYAPDLGAAITLLVEKNARGIFHCAGPDVLGRYDFGIRAAKRLGLPAELLQSVATRELNQPAARPLNAGLRCDSLIALGFTPRGIEAGVDAFAALATAA
jgi:dTDP-4-dehydrorhamnose reductase